MRNTAYPLNQSTSFHIRWSSLHWAKLQRHVFRLQQRIYHAQSLGNHRKVRALQRLLVHSRANLLLSIRRVSQVNKGRRTAGIDRITIHTNKAREDLFLKMTKEKVQLHKARPNRRIYIEKKNGKLRPLSIPTVKDRIYQNILKNALEPQWEAQFEPTIFGFRRNRSIHDAIARIFQTCHKGGRQWIFEGDFKGCFDNLSHEFILQKLKYFPYRECIRKWLLCGYIDNDVFERTPKGTGQGSLISPLLAVIALNGMEEALHITYRRSQSKTGKVSFQNTSRYSMSMYADDFVIMCRTEEDAYNIKDLLTPYLLERGLSLSEEKTHITKLDKGFDFLGFNVRMYHTSQRGKLLIKPSKDNIAKAKQNIRSTIRSCRGQNLDVLIGKLNPKITGIANSWRNVVAKEIFAKTDNHTRNLVYRFLRRMHNKKSNKWISQQYYRPDNKGKSKSKYIFTAPDTNKQLKRMDTTLIKYHRMIQHQNSRYDRSLKEYFEKRYSKPAKRKAISP